MCQWIAVSKITSKFSWISGSHGAAEILLGPEADSEHLKAALNGMLEKEKRTSCAEALKKLTGDEIPAKKIAEIIYKKIYADKRGV